jgi:MFS family permease
MNSRGSLGVALLPMMLVLFIATLDQTIVAAALGPIGQALGAHDVTWIVTSYLLTSAVATLLLGRLADVFGRKRVFQMALGVFVAASALCSAAHTLPALVLFRALQGLGGGALSSLVMTIVAALAPPRERGKYQAALGVVPAVAVMGGPIVGGLIVQYVSWPWIFLVNVPVGIIAMVLVAVCLRIPGEGHAVRPAYDRSGLRSALLAPGIFWTSALLFMLATTVLFVGMLCVPLLLQSVYSLSPVAAGASIIPMLLGLVIASGVAGTTVSHTGRYRAIPVMGTVCMCVGLGWLSLLLDASSAVAIMVAGTLLGAGVGLVIQGALLAGQNAVDERHLGLGTGVLNFFKTVGGALGASVLVVARALCSAPGMSTAMMYRVCFGMGLGVALAGLLLALILRERPLSATMTDVAAGRTETPEY